MSESGPQTMVVEVQDLAFRRQGRVIFDGVDMVFRRGRVTAIMGPSGTGKTTLLRLIGGQLRPDRGRILVGGQTVHELRGQALYELRRSTGTLFQSGALFTDLSVFENVAFPLREHLNLPEPVLRALVLMKLETVGLRGARYLMPAQLSGGMARRVALARALVLDPQVVMYDEPFTGQDPISMGVLAKLIRDLTDALGLASIVVSHDVAETAAIADHIYAVSEGRVVADGTPAELEASASPWLRQFLHGDPDGPVPFHYPAPALADDLLGVVHGD